MQLKIKKLNKDAKVPSFAHHNDAGMDLYCAEEITIQKDQRVQISTGIALEIPDGYVGLVWDKSGLSHNFGLKIVGGVIDAGYRGEIKIGIINLGDGEHTFNIGDKITQLLIQKVEHPNIVEVEELAEAERGDKGFGSTGK
ncbi:dUTP diphosphatase [Candidatus Pacebacteria bacterium]|nr:dUTP diphosphatase [Candidatus Paceibacterota bacterium]